MRVYIVQPTNRLSEEEIEKSRSRAVKKITESGYDVVNIHTTTSDNKLVRNTQLLGLSRVLELISRYIDAVYFVKDFQYDAHCMALYEICVEYGVERIFEQEDLLSVVRSRK